MIWRRGLSLGTKLRKILGLSKPRKNVFGVTPSKSRSIISCWVSLSAVAVNALNGTPKLRRNLPMFR